MRQDKVAQHWLHERVSAVLEKTVDPELEAPMQSELRPEHFVFAEDEEKDTDADSKHCQGAAVRIIRDACSGFGHKERRDSTPRASLKIRASEI